MSRLPPRLRSPFLQSSPGLRDAQSSSNAAEHGHGQPSKTAVTAADAATFTLIRRTLYSRTLNENGHSRLPPIEEVLPPLTSSNELDLQLYGFIAIIIREFVYAWYSKITPDQQFVAEVVQTIAHCTRGLEQRLRKVDLAQLLFDEVPGLLEAHVEAYRISRRKPLNTSCTPSPRAIYHSIWPTPALDPVPETGKPVSVQEWGSNEQAYRQILVQGVLAVLLPSEDLENDCLTSLVGQIFSEMILGNGIGAKASEPWLLWEVITKVVQAAKEPSPDRRAQRLPSLSQDRGIDKTEGSPSSSTLDRIRGWVEHMGMCMLILRHQFSVVAAFLRFCLFNAVPEKPADESATHATKNEPVSTSGDANRLNRSPKSVTPVLSMHLWTCIAAILNLHHRMPWLAATITLFQYLALHGPLQIGNKGGMLERYLSRQLQTRVLDAAHLPGLLRTLLSALFPNNQPAPPRPTPSPAEQLQIRRSCAEAILDAIPELVSDAYCGTLSSNFILGLVGLGHGGGGSMPHALTSAKPPSTVVKTGTTSTSTEDVERDTSESSARRSDPAGISGTAAKREEKIAQIEREWLDLFSDAYCNKHLLYGLVELVLVRLLPELAERGVEELLAERLG